MKLDTFHSATRIVDEITYLKKVLKCLNECGSENAEIASINGISTYSNPNILSHVRIKPELLKKIITVVDLEIKSLEDEFYKL